MLGTNGGGFFNANSAHPFDEPDGVLRLPRDLRASCSSRSRSPTPTGGWSGTSARATRCFAVMVTIWLGRRPRSRTLFEVERQPEARRARASTRRSPSTRPAGTSRARRSGSAPTGSATVGRVDHRDVERLRQLDARQLHAARRDDAARPHEARRGQPGRRRRRPERMLVLALLAVFIAGLMVGRTPEYLGQEDPGDRGEARRALHPRDAGRACSVGAGIAIRDARCSNVSIFNPGPHGFTRGALRVHVGGEQQRLGVRRHHRQHAVHEHRARHRDADRPLLPHHPDAGDRRVARPQEGQGARRRPGRSRPTRRCSSVLLFGVIVDRRRPHVPSRRSRSAPSSSSSASRRSETMTMTRPGETKAERVGRRSCSTVRSRRAVGDSFVKLNPRTLMKNPVMFVVEVGSVLTTILFFTDLGLGQHERERVRRAGGRVPLVHRAVRELRRGGRRGPGQGAGRHAAQDPLRDDGQPPARRTASIEEVPGTAARPRRRGRGRRGRGHPERRRRRRGHRQHRRVGDHRRVGAGHPGVRRRPLGGHRRHARALGPRSSCASPPDPARRSSTG